MKTLQEMIKLIPRGKLNEATHLVPKGTFQKPEIKEPAMDPNDPKYDWRNPNHNPSGKKPDSVKPHKVSGKYNPKNYPVLDAEHDVHFFDPDFLYDMVDHFPDWNTMSELDQIKAQLSFVAPMPRAGYDFDEAEKALDKKAREIQKQIKKTVKEDSHRTTDDILQMLTKAYATCRNHRDSFTDFKVIETVYELLRDPLMKGDMVGFNKAYDYVAGKYPDAFDLLMDEVPGGKGLAEGARDDSYFTLSKSVFDQKIKERFGEVTRKTDKDGRWIFTDKNGVDVGLSDIDGEGDRTWKVFKSRKVAEGTGLSPKTLSSYKKAAGEDATAHDKEAMALLTKGHILGAKKHTEIANKRFKGINKATMKQFDNDAKGIKESVDYADTVADGLPAGLASEKDILDAAFDVVAEKFGRKKAQGMFRDEDFPSEVVTAYRAKYRKNSVKEGTTRGGFSGSAAQAQHEIQWLKDKIATLPPTKVKQIKDLERQIKERELSIAFPKSVKEAVEKKPLKTHSYDCKWSYGGDCGCGGETLTHDSGCYYRYGHDCDCGLDKIKNPNVDRLNTLDSDD